MPQRYKVFTINESFDYNDIIDHLNDEGKSGNKFIGSITVPETTDKWAKVIVITEKYSSSPNIETD